MHELLDEAARMPDAAIQFARTTEWVKTPEEFVPLRDSVRTKHAIQLRELHEALDHRFGQPNAEWMGVFRAAAEMALMAQVGGNQIESGRNRLRELWEVLLSQT